jgi:6-phosphogluconolactonase
MPTFPDPDALAHAAASAFCNAAREAVEKRGRFLVALSGGSTPQRLYARLATMSDIPWEQTHLFFGDERFVPPTHEQSNERMAREVLIRHIQPAGAHGVVRADSAEACADYYEELVRELLGPDLALDLALLGLGTDGHTASLFPHQPAVHEDERLVVATGGGVGIAERITMTVPLLRRSRKIWFLVAGEDKGPALRRTLESDEDWNGTPAQAVARHANVTWYLDRAAEESAGLKVA